eukprot:CAMPEP_0174346270 /NCGR_PEP_ID=MMETSP0811_2-20130205/1907_1 /TAXON_ID=73025 ORGANISM="Eutreptiella gymnastica-like, Strain CCMP1594" /NCGR_SAMPLE_ID=MMETSP0811_2 /ASSEMBLY_ACC=CAM_ASM_000667 /LENGTH=131 /DNA_ID=CAMNT_0015470673 /DNA_START=311 /DNA_END=702 /DNA_ORIENTATION=-
MASQPQTPAQPTQPTVAASVHRKRSLQSTLDAFLKPNPIVADDGTDDIVQLTGSPTPLKRTHHCRGGSFCVGCQRPRKMPLQGIPAFAPPKKLVAAPQPRAKLAAKRTGLAVQAGTKASAKPAPHAIASSS